MSSSSEAQISFTRLSRLARNHAGSYFAVLDGQGRTLEFDAAKATQLGIEPSNIAGVSASDALLRTIDPEDWALVVQGEIKRLFPRTEFYAHGKRSVLWDAEYDAGAGRIFLLGSTVGGLFEGSVELEQVTESLRRYDRLMGNLPGMAYRCRHDKKWTMEYVSDGAESLTGYTKQELLSGAVTFGETLIAPEERERVFGIVADALERREAFTVNYPISRRDGEIRYVWERGVGIYDRHGKVVALEGFVADVTERVRAEMALQGAKEEAESLNRAKDEFLAVMSHEMRTPLNPVLGFSDLLLRRVQEAETRECLQIINRSGRKLLRQIEDILDFVRIEKGKTSVEPRNASPWQFCQHLAKDLEAKRGSNVLVLENGCASGAAPFDGGMRAVFDPDLVGQVLSNLLVNAFKFTNEGVVTLRAGQVLGRNGATALRFEVEDTGIGIELEMQRSIFQPFTQVESNYKRKYGGVGLGLAICSKIAKLLDGSIGLRSEPGKGSLFWFEVPVKSEQEVQSTDTVEASLLLPRLSRSLSVLVVEDNRDNLAMISTYLTTMGAEVATAGDGETALRLCRERDFDALLLDLSMPGMDGFELVERLEKVIGGARRPIMVALTAHASREARQRCFDCGMNEFATKPIAYRDLLALLERQMGLRVSAAG